MRRTVLMLASVTFLALMLGSCGREGGQGGATSAETAGSQTTSATTAEMTSSTVELTPVNSDASGTASFSTDASGPVTLSDTDGGVEVVLKLQNLESLPDHEQPADIHQGGTCADERAGQSAPVQYPLNSVFTAANHAGTSRTTIQGVSVAQLFSGPAKYIAVHDEQHGNQTPPSIACADLSSSSSGESTTGTTS